MQVDLDTLRGFFRSAPFMADLGVEPTAVEPGRVSTRLAVEKRHCQHTGVVHAGVIAALADHTMGASAQTLAAEGHWVLTAEFKTSCCAAPAANGWNARPGLSSPVDKSLSPRPRCTQCRAASAGSWPRPAAPWP